MKVLIVEDEDAIAVPLAEGLTRAGYEPTRVATAADALTAAASIDPDVILLDVRLPDGDGLSVCRDVRTTSRVPIIIVSSLDDEIDRVVGLEVGADDYVVKPFGIRELVARIRAVTRRTGAGADAPDVAPADHLVVGTLRLDLTTRTATIREQRVDLTRREFDLLERLARDAGSVVSREQLMRDVWQTHWYGSAKTIDVHVGTLRRKLGESVAIDAVRGVGYSIRPAS